MAKSANKLPVEDEISMPLIIVDHGKPLKDRMSKSHVDEADVMQAARASLGLETMDEVKYAVPEKDGSISVNSL
jgi:uncharacterized membrane protein YcaP (DUF421 family)